MPTPLPRRTWVEIDPSALRHNAKIARDFADGAAVMAVVKADGYGHGLAEVTHALAPVVDAFGVATLREALAVRQIVGSGTDVMLLGALLPDERESALRSNLSVTVSGTDEARAYSELATKIGAKARVHLAIDTGMGRVGFIENEFAAAVPLLSTLPGIEIEGLATHFPSADEDPEFTRGQITRFAALRDSASTTFRWTHLCNSAGVLGFGAAGGNLIRPGLMLYGVAPSPDQKADLKPALAWRARITLVRDLPAGSGISYGRRFVTADPTRVATLAVGYGDGYPRHLSGNDAEVLIGGRRCPLLGRVTMDQIMVDVSEGKPPLPGDTATLIGTTPGHGDAITASELANRSGTIPWEIFTGIAPRVAREVIPDNS
jgi:alanine racemase